MTSGDTTRAGSDPLAAIGRILSGQTHELTNVLSIVLELGGLLEDLAQIAPEGGDRLASLADRLRRQGRRGQSMVSDLNALAHTLDHEHTTIEAGRLAALVGALGERPARQKQVTIDVHATDAAAAWSGDPMEALQTVLATLHSALQRTAASGSVDLEVGVSGQRLVATARGGPLADPAAKAQEGDRPGRWIEAPTTAIVSDADDGDGTDRFGIRFELGPSEPAEQTTGGQA